jgi:hypothetical protein
VPSGKCSNTQEKSDVLGKNSAISATSNRKAHELLLVPLLLEPVVVPVSLCRLPEEEEFLLLLLSKFKIFPLNG